MDSFSTFRYLIFLLFCMAIFVGQTNGKIQKKIVGGISLEISVAPYIVSLQFHHKHKCGASLIRPSYVLTAAHCVDEGSADDYSVRGGSKYHAKGGTVIEVILITSHPYYDDISSAYDVALLELKIPFTIGPNIKPIPLADKEPKEGERLCVIGWGAIKEKNPNHPFLQFVWVPVVSRVKCKRIFFNYVINRAMICAGYERGGKDACQGDSGGPAVLNGKQVGIVSWGAGCAKRGIPGVYTNIPHVRKWIASLMP